MKYALRRFILKKKLENIFYLFAYGVNDSSHLLLIIFETINVLMTVDASCVCCFCSFLVPRRKVGFGELFDSLSFPALDIF